MKIGFAVWSTRFPDLVWNQCDGALGRHGDLTFEPWDFRADHVLCLGLPIDERRNPRPARLPGLLAKGLGRYGLERARAAFRAIGRNRRDVTVLFLEPPDNLDEGYLAAAREFADGVFAPDARAPRPIRLPSFWLLHASVDRLAAMPPPTKSVELAWITSGRRSIAGHVARLDFAARLRRALDGRSETEGRDAPPGASPRLALFGQGLDATLGSRGGLTAKEPALMPARFALGIENYAAGDLYVSEKLFDPLLAWCLPLYFGPGAPEKILPPGSFIRLPDLGERGIECVRRALDEPGLYERSLPAIAEARRRIIGDLRTVEWFRRERLAEIGGA